MLIDAVIGVQCPLIGVVCVKVILLDSLKNALVEEKLSNVWACAPAVVVAIGRDGTVDMRSKVDMCCTARVPARKNASDGDNTVRVGGLKPTGERFSLSEGL